MSLAIQMPLTVLAVDHTTSATRTYFVPLRMAGLSALVRIQAGNQSIALCHRKVRLTFPAFQISLLSHLLFSLLNKPPVEDSKGLFDFNRVTNCSDDTFCPNPNNQSCCDNNQGVVWIFYSNNAHIPNDLSTYYANAGYSISTTASASAIPTSTRLAITTNASPTSSTVMMTSQISTSSAAKTSPSSTSSSSTSSGGLSSRASAGVGVASTLGVLLLLGLALILFIHKRRRKNGVVERILPGTMMGRA